jgi:hypothetical protein
MAMNSTGMSDRHTYQIRIQGHLHRHWEAWFAGLEITLEENGDTLLTGTMVDQAALFGFLRQVRNLGMPLIAVKRIARDQEKK